MIFVNCKFTFPFEATNLDDNIFGTENADVIRGYAGDDNIYGLGGDDEIYGDSGNDRIFGGDGNNVLNGGAGDDRLHGSNGSDTLIGGPGNDVFYVSEGDIVYGGAGYDTVYSQRGNALGFYNLTLGSTSSIERVYGTNSPLRDVIDASQLGNRVIVFAQFGDDTVIGSAFNDYINGGSGNDVLDGGEGIADWVTYLGANGSVFVDLSVTGMQNTQAAGADTLLNFENLEGSNFGDFLAGDSGNNYVDGQGGVDFIEGGGGNDTLDGGGGDDTLDGSIGNDTLRGGTGTDFAFYTSGSINEFAITDNGGGHFTVSHATWGTDQLYDVEFIRVGATDYALSGNSNATAGDDVIQGTFADDVLFGLGGNDTLNGGAGNDTLFGGAGDDVMNGGDGSDTIYGSTGSDTFNGDTGDDNLFAGGDGTSDILNGGDGNYNLYGDHLEVYNGGAGFDTVYIQDLTFMAFNTSFTDAQGIERVYATSLDDRLDASGLTNGIILFGLDGNDTLSGGSGNDVLNGGAGADRVAYSTATSRVIVDLSISRSQDTRGAGVDRLISIEQVSGSSFGDILLGNFFSNYLLGGDGNDYIDGGESGDYMDGGAGTSDWVSFQSLSSAAVIDLSNTGVQATNDIILNFENVEGSNFGDSLTGDAGFNYIDGKSGNDLINGGLGNDVLIGGSGADTFLFETGFGADRITDFTDGADLLRFDIAGLTQFSQLSVTQSGADTLVTYDGNSVRLSNTTATDITSADVAFGAPTSQEKVDETDLVSERDAFDNFDFKDTSEMTIVSEVLGTDTGTLFEDDSTFQNGFEALVKQSAEADPFVYTLSTGNQAIIFEDDDGYWDMVG